MVDPPDVLLNFGTPIFPSHMLSSSSSSFSLPSSSPVTSSVFVSGDCVTCESLPFNGTPWIRPSTNATQCFCGTFSQPDRPSSTFLNPGWTATCWDTGSQNITSCVASQEQCSGSGSREQLSSTLQLELLPNQATMNVEACVLDFRASTRLHVISCIAVQFLSFLFGFMRNQKTRESFAQVASRHGDTF